MVNEPLSIVHVRGLVDRACVHECAHVMYFHRSRENLSTFLLQAVAILKRTKGKVSLVVARKQGLPGSPPASDKATSASVSPRRETGSPRLHKKGPPVAKKPVRESTSDAKKPGSPRKAESPKMTKKPFESVPTGGALTADVPTGSVPTGSPLASRREPVQPQAFEPVVQIVQQSPREAARKFITPLFFTDCFKAVGKIQSRRLFVDFEYFRLSLNCFCLFVLSAAVSPTLTPPPNPRTIPIIPGQECVIEIPKGNTGLGLSIVGGADTLLVSRTCDTKYPCSIKFLEPTSNEMYGCQ